MSDNQEEATPIALPIRFMDTEGLISRYANNLLIQHSGQEFMLMFYEVRPPLIVGSPEQIQKQVEALEFVAAECVARVIITPDRIPEFITALQENWAQFQSETKHSGIM